MSKIKNVILCGVFYYIIQKMRRFGQSLSKFFYNPDIQTVIKIQKRSDHMLLEYYFAVRYGERKLQVFSLTKS